MAEDDDQMKMTKAEIIEHIYETSGIFGTFEIRTRKGREKARNPKTGEIVPVKTHGVTVFRPGKELKKMAWNLRH